MKTPDEIKKGIEYLSIKDITKKLDAWKEGIAYDYAEDAATDALALIQQLEAQVPKWISVEERLPENERMVIGYTPCDGYMFIGYYVENRNWKQWYIVTAMRSTKYMTKKVTHWMPLPESPKEDDA